MENGHALLARITGTGCMVSGIVAACAAVEGDPLYAAAAALLAFGVAGEVAAAAATGPGSLRPILFDALYSLDEATIAKRGKVQWA
jgi:hydroxyethylthiazole kinase